MQQFWVSSHSSAIIQWTYPLNLTISRAFSHNIYRLADWQQTISHICRGHQDIVPNPNKKIINISLSRV
jgi:hypothetical protein